MKKLLLSLLLVTTGFCFGEAAIVNYESSHKDAVMELCFQDTKELFVGSAVIDMGFMTNDQFYEEAKKVIEAVLADSNRVKWVVIEEGKVIGFIDFFVTKEQSLESIMKQAKVQFPGLTPEQEAQIVAGLAHLKKTDAECEVIGKIETVVISRDFRRRGHARTLIKLAIEQIKKACPEITRVELDVNTDNEGARKLYISEEFEESKVQPQAFVMMKAVQYEKAI